MNTEERMLSLGYCLPSPPLPLGSYSPAMQAGELLFLSGMLPVKAGVAVFQGKIGAELTIEQGRDAVCIAVLNALAVIKAQVGNLDNVKSIIRLALHIACTSTFTAHATLADAGSKLLQDIFLLRGGHARLVYGCLTLPSNMPIELELICQIRNT